MILTVPAMPAGADTSGLAAYMKARAADGAGQVTIAAGHYAQALAARPDDREVALRAYREALAAGDYALADRAEAALRKLGDVPADVALNAIARAAAAHDPAAIDAAIDALHGPLTVLAPSLRGWAALARGGDALKPFAIKPGNDVGKRFNDENEALILIAMGRTADGLKRLTALLGNDQASTDLRMSAADLLLGQGRRAEAQALLAGDVPPIMAMRANPGPGVAPGFAFGASRLFSRIGADLALGPVGPLPIALARAALRAEPGNDRARMLLAFALAKDDATDAAVAALDAIGSASPWRAQARAGRVQILQNAGRTADALALARDLAQQPLATPADVERFGDLLVLNGDNAEAAKVYKGLLAGRERDWSAWFQYGGALEQAGRWKEAEPALAKAVELAPDQPLALNYLGYARIDHGGAVAPALALLERAHALKPDDPSIADSLGWGYFRSGQIARALALIEAAAAAAPDNAEISEHLGDIYWSLGRRYEARYAWAAARVMAEPEEAARIAGKIAHGLAARP